MSFRMFGGAVLLLLFTFATSKSFGLNLLAENAKRKNSEHKSPSARWENTTENGVKKMSGIRYGISVPVDFFIGFGTGQAIQERWQDRGYIFTAVELGALGIVFFGAGECISSLVGKSSSGTGCGALFLGIFTFYVARVWGFVDTIIGPWQNGYDGFASRQRFTVLPLVDYHQQEVLGDTRKVAQLDLGIDLSYRF